MNRGSRNIVLALALVLQLWGCAKPKLDVQQYSYGYGQCDGTLGSFDVYLILNAQQGGGSYQLSIIPVSMNNPGDIISVTITNSNLGYKQLVGQVVATPDTEIDAGYLTSADLQNYTILALTPYQPGVSFPDAQNSSDALCYLPQLGQGVNQQPVEPLQ
jgi:hypothetical protein